MVELVGEHHRLLPTLQNLATRTVRSTVHNYIGVFEKKKKEESYLHVKTVS